MDYILSLGKGIIEKRELIWDLGKADFRKRFVGSYFDIVWVFIQPIVIIAIYASIFGEGDFKTPPPVTGISYVAWLVPSIVPQLFYSKCMNAITGCLQEYGYLVKKMVFKVGVLPLVKLVNCLLVCRFFVLVITSMYLVTGIQVRITWVRAIYYILATSMLAPETGFFISAVDVFFKDMTQTVGIYPQSGIWTIPIVYTESMFSDRPWIASLLKFNPSYYIVTGYRDSIFAGNWFWERLLMTVYYWTVAITVFLVELKMFKYLRPHFSNVLQSVCFRMFRPGFRYFVKSRCFQ